MNNFHSKNCKITMESNNLGSKNQPIIDEIGTMPDSLLTVINSPLGVWIEYTDRIHLNFWSSQTFNNLSIAADPSFIPSIAAIQRYINPADRAVFSNILLKMKDRTLLSYDSIAFRYKGPDQINKHLVLTAEPQFDKEGVLEFWTGTIQNVTKIKQRIENAENLSNSIFEILDRLPYLVAVVDNKGGFTYWNKACEYLTGYKSNEVLGSRELVKKVFPEQEERSKFRNSIKESLSKPLNIELDIFTKKGEKRLISWTVFSSIARNDNWNTVVIGSDITKVRLADESKNQYINKLEVLTSLTLSLLTLDQNDNFFHHLGTTLENVVRNCFFVVNTIDSEAQFLTVDGIYGFTSEEWEYALEILGWNPVGRRFQISKETIQSFADMQPQPLGNSIYEVTEGVISSVTSRSIERTFSVERIYSAGIISQGKLVGMVSVFSRKEEFDYELSLIEEIISLYALAFERRNKEDSYMTAMQRAEEADRLKTAFMANFGHEIRTPMNAILGFTQLLNIPNLHKDKRKQYIEIINNKGRMLVKLINDMVDVSRVDTGQLTVVKSEFNLNHLMQSLRAFYHNERVFQQREAVEIVLTIPENLEQFELYCDEGRLEQVFTNLLDNALKFTEKGTIEFGYSLLDDTVKFFVKDTGIGIDEKMHKVIFDRYKQVEENIVRTKEGKGLGLAISKGIVELLGGTIWVESKPGDGATFNFSIPITIYKEPEESDVLESNNTERSFPNWKNKVVLVAEDEEINYLFINELLSQTGMTVIWARDGVQAVELVSNIKTIDVILMDVRMPNKDGYAASLEIRQINPGIPIIAQTAYAYTEDRAKAEAAGCNDYITKPINSNELLDIMNKYLG